MNYREIIEKREKETLSPFACCSADSAGRLKPETESDIRTVFCRDRDRIIHSKAFRRLKHKTQVFLSPTGDHYRTRLTHTLEVSQISRTIARCLGLNEDLTEAIALGHDLGHTPFGHAGERVLNEICPFRFFHNEQSLRVCTDLEKEGEGLNLTREVLDGILCHTGDKKADTLEGQLVRLSDKIAYINHDIDDAVRAGLLKESDLPQRAVELLGTGHSNRINAMVMGTIEGSLNKPYIEMTDAAGEGFDILHNFLFSEIYVDSRAKDEEGKAQGIIETIYGYYTQNPAKMPSEYIGIIQKDGVERAVADYVSSMTDRFAVDLFTNLFIPKSWDTK
ncbi:MAG: deoxyguanosinetriphosphate triphosphohydrolase [Clostridia bacterium]|nr:deoxyguanosinetriphosphate triphosphohydrolase [Clostridia bacterium]